MYIMPCGLKCGKRASEKRKPNRVEAGKIPVRTESEPNRADEFSGTESPESKRIEPNRSLPDLRQSARKFSVSRLFSIGFRDSTIAFTFALPLHETNPTEKVAKCGVLLAPPQPKLYIYTIASIYIYIYIYTHMAIYIYIYTSIHIHIQYHNNNNKYNNYHYYYMLKKKYIKNK